MCASEVVRPALSDDDPFFPEVVPTSRLDDDERATVEGVRGLLARLEPGAVRPARTSAVRVADDVVELQIRHAGCDTRLTIEVSGPRTTLRWLGGRLTGAWGTGLERALTALLLGRDELVLHLRWGTVHTIETLVWDAPDGAPRLLHRRRVGGALPALCRRLPGPARVERMSLSFDRDEGIGPVG